MEADGPDPGSFPPSPGQAAVADQDQLPAAASGIYLRQPPESQPRHHRLRVLLSPKSSRQLTKLMLSSTPGDSDAARPLEGLGIFIAEPRFQCSRCPFKVEYSQPWACVVLGPRIPRSKELRFLVQSGVAFPCSLGTVFLGRHPEAPVPHTDLSLRPEAHSSLCVLSRP